VERIEYDEFSLFHENAEEYGLPYDGPPEIRREQVEVDPGRHLSALVWGHQEPQLVLLHGGAQNAHTWDTVAMALKRPLVAIDLPGHGHSGPPPAGAQAVGQHAVDVAVAVEALAPRAGAVVGMSLGGLTALALSRHRPDLVRRLVLVDVTPGVDEAKARHIVDFVNGPESFADFDEILARTVQFNPTRSVSSLRRGILHNAVQREDGSWVWRYARFREGGSSVPPDFGDLWDAVSAFSGPLLLLRGTAEGSVVSDADEAELLRRAPAARVERVAGAGHSIQGDRPLDLARLIDEFVP
jgi:pimeloyl-ACP methyl ester carboxylesterase